MLQPQPSFWRAAAERMSRGRIFKRSLQTPSGRRLLHVTPEASLRYWLPRSLNGDTPLCEFANRYVSRGQKIWDIGANVGVFTFLSAAAVGTEGDVLSVEADPYLSQLLIRSALDLPEGDARPQMVTAAVSNVLTLADFGVTRRSRASNHLLSSTGCTQTGGVRFSFKVPCLTLDWLLENTFAPQIVKMDIEGVEASALTAAPRLLSEVRPVFHLEVWSEIAENLKDVLGKRSYLFFDGENDPSLKNPLSDPPWCTLAVPAEKHANFARSRAVG